MVRVGDTGTFTPNCFGDKEEYEFGGYQVRQQVPGRVVWIHPKRRFFLVEFIVHGHKFCETFSLRGAR